MVKGKEERIIMFKFEIDDLITRADGMKFNDGSRVAYISARQYRFGTPCYGLNGTSQVHWTENELKFVMKG
jgi:hypothetical protein